MMAPAKNGVIFPKRVVDKGRFQESAIENIGKWGNASFYSGISPFLTLFVISLIPLESKIVLGICPHIKDIGFWATDTAFGGALREFCDTACEV